MVCNKIPLVKCLSNTRIVFVWWPAGVSTWRCVISETGRGLNVSEEIDSLTCAFSVNVLWKLNPFFLPETTTNLSFFTGECDILWYHFYNLFQDEALGNLDSRSDLGHIFWIDRMLASSGSSPVEWRSDFYVPLRTKPKSMDGVIYSQERNSQK